MRTLVVVSGTYLSVCVYEGRGDEAMQYRPVPLEIALTILEARITIVARFPNHK